MIRRERNYRGANLDRGSLFVQQKRWEKYADRAVRLASRARTKQQAHLQRLAVKADRRYKALCLQTGHEKVSRDQVHFALGELVRPFCALATIAKAMDVVRSKRTKLFRMRRLRLHHNQLRSLSARRSSMQSSFNLFDTAGTPVTFTLQGGSDDAKGNRASYAATDLSTAGAPVLLKFENQVKPVGSDGSDKHRAMVQYVVRDAQNRPHVFSATLTWSVPRLPSAMHPEATAKDALTFLIGAVAEVRNIPGGDSTSIPTDGVSAMVDNLLP